MAENILTPIAKEELVIMRKSQKNKTMDTLWDNLIKDYHEEYPVLSKELVYKFANRHHALVLGLIKEIQKIKDNEEKKAEKELNKAEKELEKRQKKIMKRRTKGFYN